MTSSYQRKRHIKRSRTSSYQRKRHIKRSRDLFVSKNLTYQEVADLFVSKKETYQEVVDLFVSKNLTSREDTWRLLYGRRLPLTMPRMRNRIMALAALALLLIASHAQAADDFADVRREIAKRHDEAVKALQDWIALPSIAAENRNFPAGAEYMAKLAREAGFQQVDRRSTPTASPASSPRSTPARRKPSASTSCTT